jgi:Kef-type K+ transport system membrane component KefB
MVSMVASSVLGVALLASADDAHALLRDIGVAVLAATLLGLIAHWTRQPIILGYLIAGALVGPTIGFKLIKDEGSIEVISEIGLILLLFIIGLEMNVKALLAAGKQLLVAGFGQFLVCAALGVGLFGLMGYPVKGVPADGLYLALMCALSSTAIVVKLLYDKGELDTLPGRMTLGILVVQDIYAILVLALQPNLANPSAGPILKAVGGTIVLLVVGFAVSKFVLRRVFSSIARAPEMVVAVSIGWCAAVCALAGALNLSKEMGALIAGLSIAAFPYSIHVTAKTLPLRDFFLTLFFVSLGMKIIAPQAWMIGIVLTMVVFTVASRFLSIYPLLVLTGAGRRTAFITSLNLSQISEFSLVIASLGLFYGHVADRTVAVTIYAMAITAVLSSYGIRFNHQLFLAFDRLMAKLGRGSAVAATLDEAKKEDRPIVLLGIHRAARALIRAAGQHDPALLSKIRVVDFNPEVLRDLNEKGIAGMFGDLSSFDTLEHAHLHHARVIVCTVPDMLLKGTDNQTLVKACRAIAPHATIVATADDNHHAEILREEGADVVVTPNQLAAEAVVPELAKVITAGGSAVGHAPAVAAAH